MVLAVSTDKAPHAIGPYSQAIVANGFVFVSGQIAANPDDGQIIQGNIGEQTKRALSNLEAILQNAGSSLSHVTKTTIYLKNMEDFAEVNHVYSTFFTITKPARATVEVSRLPKDVLIEIDAIAIVANSN